MVISTNPMHGQGNWPVQLCGHPVTIINREDEFVLASFQSTVTTTQRYGKP